MKIWILLLIAVVSTFGRPQSGRHLEQERPEPYDYHYKIENAPTRTYFGQSENGDPTGKVIGNYYVLLADGRLMTVDYLVNGDSGYVPKISFKSNANL